MIYWHRHNRQDSTTKGGKLTNKRIEAYTSGGRNGRNNFLGSVMPNSARTKKIINFDWAYLCMILVIHNCVRFQDNSLTTKARVKLTTAPRWSRTCYRYTFHSCVTQIQYIYIQIKNRRNVTHRTWTWSANNFRNINRLNIMKICCFHIRIIWIPLTHKILVYTK